MKEIKKFNQMALLITALAYVIIAIVFYFIFPEKFHWSLLIAPAFVALVTAFMHKKLMLSSDARAQKFTNMFLGMTGLKLMAYLFYILIYVLTLKTFAIPFLAIFFPLYIVFTTLEVSQLLKHLNQEKE